MRKPIQLEPKEEGGEVDEYWTEWIKDVDGYGTDLDAFARRLSLILCFSVTAQSWLIFLTTEPAENLLQERQLGLRRISWKSAQIRYWMAQGRKIRRCSC